MPMFYEKSQIRYSLIAIIGILILTVLFLFVLNWIIGILVTVCLCIALFFLRKSVLEYRKEMDSYISTLSYRLKKVGEEALMEMPIGIMLIDDDFRIEWANPYITSIMNEDTLIGRDLLEIHDSLLPLFKQDSETEAVITLDDQKFKVIIKREERLLYFVDVTEQIQIEKQYEDERTALAYIFLDNYDEITQAMDDQTKSAINSKVTALLNKWAKDFGVFIKRVSSERFLAVLNEQILTKLEKSKFSILDEVREKTTIENVSLTLSIGIGTGVSSLQELGDLAQSGLDLALGRGGDQVAIKQINGKVQFYGGKTNPMEKRTRVRARVISHALKEIVTESDKVMIMGHKFPDMDAIGSSIGILKVAQANGKEGFIVLDEEAIDSGVIQLLEEVKQHSELWSWFITPDEALEIMTDETLLIILDTHKPSLVIDERLLSISEHVIVIDHHRRGEEFIKDPILVYMEPYASSTAELVTELLEYQPKPLKMNMIEATALLAGIVVDTKSFTLRTGSRTFDAASYLRGKGADTVLVHKFMKEDIENYVRRASLIQNTMIYKNGIAIAIAKDDSYFEQVTLAQTADTLLTMNNVVASFVIARRSESSISISARSLGEINVQLIMEALNGGGHLTNAATQLQDITIDDASDMLKNAIDEYLEGGTKS
ncbi:DHH family phosphoesterase [Metabacillus niabensis]|uniref:Cyclic-di-AMP phosphodiesterase n=1 Tax=Metabacillus niabensis TaxID=324854 RepID=A0ABT9Z957_9BACI|nr:DHH family phosphoesterase [Metabacillus niabensis]MDQ0228138.1 c-di-AMP phosphodiesterase-like protein [Metabacillus niabensis]